MQTLSRTEPCGHVVQARKRSTGEPETPRINLKLMSVSGASVAVVLSKRVIGREGGIKRPHKITTATNCFLHFRLQMNVAPVDELPQACDRTRTLWRVSAELYNVKYCREPGLSSFHSTLRNEVAFFGVRANFLSNAVTKRSSSEAEWLKIG